MKQKKIIVENSVVSIVESSNFDPKKTLIFLHWWQQNALCFEKIFQILEEKNISFLSLDLPWFWGTPLVNKNWHIEDYGRFVIKIIQKLEIKKPILVGHSFWWRISIFIASFYENIEKIILIGSAGIKKKYNPFYFFTLKIAKYIFNIPLITKIWEKVKNKLRTRDYKNSWVMKQIFLNAIGNDLQKYMLQIKIPALLIWWEKDTETPINEAKIINEKIKNSSLKIIPLWTHFVYEEFPEEVAKYILNFIQ